MENRPNLTFLTFKIDLWDDSTKSTFVQYIGTFLIKLHAKEEKKLSNSFWEIKILSEKLTTDDDGRRRRRRRRTTDESALEKLRCHSAGGAKKWPQFPKTCNINTLYTCCIPYTTPHNPSNYRLDHIGTRGAIYNSPYTQYTTHHYPDTKYTTHHCPDSSILHLTAIHQ